MPLAEPKTSTRNADYTPIEPPIPCQFDRFGKLTIGQIVSENSDYYTVEFENGAEARYPKKNVTRLDPESLLAMPLAQRPRSIEKVSLNFLKRLPDTQQRVNGVNPKVVQDYVEVFENGGRLPALKVVRTIEGLDLLWDGNHTFEALEILGIKQYDCEIVLGTLEDAVTLSYGANSGHGFRRSNADKRKATIAAWLAPHNEGLQTNEIAALCKVSATYAGEIRKLPEVVSALGPPPETVKVTRNGTTYEMKRPARKAPTVEPEIEESADDRVWVETAEGSDEYRAYTPEHSIEQPIPKRFGMQAAISDEDFEEPDLDDLEIPEPEVLLAASKGKASNAQHSSESNEHYTPSPAIEAARSTMGSIEFDPFSSAIANQNVKADGWLGIDDDAFTVLREIECHYESAWVNPHGGKFPPGHPMAGRSVQAAAWDLIFELYQKGCFEQVTFLAFSVELLAKRSEMYTFPLCFTCKGAESEIINGMGRLKFLNENLEPQGQPTHASAFIYLPKRSASGEWDPEYVDRFFKNFQQFGKVGVLTR